MLEIRGYQFLLEITNDMVKSQNNTICEAIISVIVLLNLYTFFITLHIVINYGIQITTRTVVCY